MGRIFDVELPNDIDLILPMKNSLSRLYSVFQNGMNNGGTGGLIYGFLFTWIGCGIQALVMAEMASMSVAAAIALAEHANWTGFRLLVASTTGEYI